MNKSAEIGHFDQLARFLQSLFRQRRNGGTQPGSGSHIVYKNSNLQRSITAAIAAVLVSFAVVAAAVGPATTSLSTSGQAQIA